MKPVDEDASEGDVEAQVVLPLLTRGEFLGFDLTEVRSKKSLAPRDIGKGNKRRIGYVPDFSIFKQSLPAVVVEAKPPSVDVAQAYAEGCLYAGEINRPFPTGINPCSVVLATNGVQFMGGHWDADPTVIVGIQEIEAGSSALDQLIQLCGNDAVSRTIEALSQQLRSSKFKRPFNQGGGAAQILSRIDPNTFAADLAPILRRYFSSRDQTTDPDIYRRAYISSDEITSYDRILESFLKDRLAQRARVEISVSRRRADELTKTISHFDEARPAGGDLQLITGGVGAGKSLFARRYREFLQPAEMSPKNHWAFLNFNSAPQSLSNIGINEWVCEAFVESLIHEGAPVDPRSAEDQERIFAPNLQDRKAFYDRMEAAQQGRGALERARDIEQWRLDPVKLARGLARYLQGDRRENVIAVFDNVDRRETEAQLAAFQTALWFMDQTRCLVILQMRDSTFEAYKNEPPLDTYRTGQIFHISPPRFIDVVKKRLELSLEAIEREAPEEVRYRTPSGVQITYPKKRAGEFLSGIYRELFQRPTNLGRLLEALAGRNVRRALDMFFAILTSGHMPEDIIASVAQGRGFRAFPEYRILRALMRQDFRFFNNDTGFIANLLHCEPRWVRPSNFLLVEVLFYLIGRRKVRGDNGQMGFVALRHLQLDLEALGFVVSDIADACLFALQKGLIEVETSSQDAIRENDCIKATASGWAHLRLLCSRVEYLAAILPTTAIDDEEFGKIIYDVMQTENRIGRPPYLQYVQLVERLELYLLRQHKQMLAHPGYADLQNSGAVYLLSKIREALAFARRENIQGSQQLDLLDG